VTADASSEIVVVFDAGHGGGNQGARSMSGLTREEDIVLQVARELGQCRPDIVLTRTCDQTLNFAERADIAQAAGADLVISGHLDSIPDAPYKRGLHAYHHPDSPYGRRLAEYAVRSAPRELRGGNSILANSVPWKGRAKCVLEAYLPYSDALLIEFGYLSNTRDLGFVRSTEGIQAMVSLVIAIAEYYTQQRMEDA